MKSAVDRYRLRASSGPDAATKDSVARVDNNGAADRVSECDRFGDRKEAAVARDGIEVFHDADSWRGDESAPSSSVVVAYLTGARTRCTTRSSPAADIPNGNGGTDCSSGSGSSSSGGADRNIGSNSSIISSRGADDGEKNRTDRDGGCCEHEAKTGAIRIDRSGVYRLSAVATSRLVALSNDDATSDRRSAVETRTLFVRLDAAAGDGGGGGGFSESVAEPVASGRDVLNVVASCVLPVCHEWSEGTSLGSADLAADPAARSTSRTAWTRLEILAHIAVLGVGDRLHFLVSTTTDPPATRLELDPMQCNATIVYCGLEPFA